MKILESKIMGEFRTIIKAHAELGVLIEREDFDLESHVLEKITSTASSRSFEAQQTSSRSKIASSCTSR